MQNLGGGSLSGVPVGNVQNLTFKNSMNGIDISWEDPGDIVFNGETTAQWSGTKVVRKEGSYPTGVDDGVVIADSTIRNEYSAEPLLDSDIPVDTQYNYALFPYTTENVYTMSDLNKGFGTKNSTPYDKILANNTWAIIDEASQLGIAKDLWNVGDQKDGYTIVEFDHDYLADGSGKAGITFLSEEQEPVVWSGNSTLKNYVSYSGSAIYNRLSGTVYNGLTEELKHVIKPVTKAWYSGSSSVASGKVNLFLFSVTEMDGSSSTAGNEGTKYEQLRTLLRSLNIKTWLRTTSWSTNDYTRVCTANADRIYISTVRYTTYNYAYGFCI